MKRHNMLLFVLILLMALGLGQAAGQAQQESNLMDPAALVAKPAGFLNKLLGSSNIRMSHSYSMEFLSAGSMHSGLGMYTNNIFMQLAPPLTAEVKIGFMHPLSGMANNTISPGGKLFLQQATVKYKPAENMQIRVDYRSYPAGYMTPFYRMR